MTPLFAYGTLRRADWRRALLDADYAAEAATLRDWERVGVAGGYLSLRRRPGALAHGVLLALDARGWALADAWEEVPLYRRVGVTVETARGPVRARTYVCAAHDATPVAAECDAQLGDDAVAAAIARFRAAQTAPRMRPRP